jgi:hypothetical protein
MNEYKPTPEEESAQRRADNDREGQKECFAALAASARCLYRSGWAPNLSLMKIQTGMKLMNDVKPVAGKRVDFVTDDDRIVFAVRIGKDGRSLEISARDNYEVDGVLYSTSILVAPNVTNSITVSTKPYDA